MISPNFTTRLIKWGTLFAEAIFYVRFVVPDVWLIEQSRDIYGGRRVLGVYLGRQKSRLLNSRRWWWRGKTRQKLILVELLQDWGGRYCTPLKLTCFGQHQTIHCMKNSKWHLWEAEDRFYGPTLITFEMANVYSAQHVVSKFVAFYQTKICRNWKWFVSEVIMIEGEGRGVDVHTATNGQLWRPHSSYLTDIQHVCHVTLTNAWVSQPFKLKSRKVEKKERNKGPLKKRKQTSPVFIITPNHLSKRVFIYVYL